MFASSIKCFFFFFPMILGMEHNEEIIFYYYKLYIQLHFAPLNFSNAWFYILNYDHCYTLHSDIKFIINLDGKIWKYLIASLSNLLKIKKKLHFTILNYTPNYILHPKLWIFIQVNSKLNVEVQSITKFIVWGTKRVFENFRV